MKRRKNVLLIVSDDHAAWALHHTGLEGLSTPNLDRLAASGTRFSDAFTPSPVCSPARASLMTGLAPSQHGIHDWLQEYDPEVGDRDWMAGLDTLPEIFQRAGYACGLSGKWHLGGRTARPRGFDWAFEMAPKMATHNGSDDYWLNGERIRLEGNRSSLVAEHAIRFLETRGGDRPFFLNVGFFATHSPYVAEGHDPDVVASYRDNDFRGMPRGTVHPWSHNENGPDGKRDREAECRRRWQGYFAAVSEIDREVGRLLDCLEDSGELDDTLVIYTSDHGLCLGHHGIWGKGNGTRPLNLTDTVLRVPLLVAGPDVERGAVVEDPVSHFDTFATLSGLSGQSPSDGLRRPGAGLFSAGRGKGEATFHEYGETRAIRTPEWKCILRTGGYANELYRLYDDPGEEHNLWDDSACSRERDDLVRRLTDWFKCFSRPEKDGSRVRRLPRHNDFEAWRDGVSERRLTSFPQACNGVRRDAGAGVRTGGRGAC